MRAYEGYFEDGIFTAIGRPINIRGRRRAVLTVTDEQIQPSRNDQELRLAWLARLDKAIRLALDEELPDMVRSAQMREPLVLTD